MYVTDRTLYYTKSRSTEDTEDTEDTDICYIFTAHAIYLLHKVTDHYVTDRARET
jgi:hypothetical protein